MMKILWVPSFFITDKTSLAHSTMKTVAKPNNANEMIIVSKVCASQIKMGLSGKANVTNLSAIPNVKTTNTKATKW